MTIAKPLQVAVGVLQNSQDQVLVTLRHKHQHQGGLWEFPGGKIHASETVAQALRREFQEELNVEVLDSSPLITIRHDYADLSVQLHVYRIRSYHGEPVGMEGQQLQWVEPEDLTTLQFPAANVPITKAVQLPDYYAILDSETCLASLGLNKLGPESVAQLMRVLQLLLEQNIKLIQGRLKLLDTDLVQKFMQQALPLCNKYGATLLLNSASPGAWENLSGVHLTSQDLLRLKSRPDGLRWLAASCHNLAQLQYAQTLGVDFVVLAPVLPTLSHPDATAIGWDAFSKMLDQVNIPVYALGGMQKNDLDQAKRAGAQGIAGIRLFL